MELNTIAMAANNPSGFAMPICGHASATGAGVITTSVVRDRQAGCTGGAKGDLGLAAYVPGTSAWSPPTS